MQNVYSGVGLVRLCWGDHDDHDNRNGGDHHKYSDYDCDHPEMMIITILIMMIIINISLWLVGVRHVRHPALSEADNKLKLEGRKSLYGLQSTYVQKGGRKGTQSNSS